MRTIATITSFYFELAGMQEQFNEKYIKSDKYPTASYSWRITNLNEINFLKDGMYNATVLNELKIHGVIHQQLAKTIIAIVGRQVRATTTFPAVVQNYQITVSHIVFNNIARQVDVSVAMKHEFINK